MKKANVYINGILAGVLEELEGRAYQFIYNEDYSGEPISLTMPVMKDAYSFSGFPPFFDGLLPEGVLLESLLRQYKIDKKDYFSQLIKVGKDLVGAVTVEEMT